MSSLEQTAENFQPSAIYSADKKCGGGDNSMEDEKFERNEPLVVIKSRKKALVDSYFVTKINVRNFESLFWEDKVLLLSIEVQYYDEIFDIGNPFSRIVWQVKPTILNSNMRFLCALEHLNTSFIWIGLKNGP